MKLSTRARAGYAVALAAGAAIGFAAVGSATAAPTAPAKAKTATYHYSLAASAFAPDGLHDTTEDYFNDWDPTTLSNTDDGRCFNAGLSLPPNATLKSVTFYYTEGSSEMLMELNRQELSNHTYVDLVDFDGSMDATGTEYTSSTMAIPAADSVVNMNHYAYSAGVCPDGNSTFSGLTITYTLPVT